MTQDKAFKLFKDGADDTINGSGRISFNEVGQKTINAYIENIYIFLDSTESINKVIQFYFNNNPDDSTSFEKDYGVFELTLKADLLQIDAWTTLDFDELSSDEEYKQKGKNLAQEVISFIEEVKSKTSI